MQAASVARVEANVDRGASALLAGACAYAAYAWLAARVSLPALAAATGAAAGLGYVLSIVSLRAVKPEARKLPVAIFDVRDIEPVEPSELLLTERYVAPPTPAEEPFVLDDILAKLGSDSRVVRLFDPAAMPTPGEMKSSIDRHLDGDQSSQRSADAAQALHEALAELRRSLR
jgi:hypothetical protein